MSAGEMAYLALVITAFFTFMGTVAFVSWYARPGAAGTQAGQANGARPDQANFKKAA
jgi:hypothetical protein